MGKEKTAGKGYARRWVRGTGQTEDVWGMGWGEEKRVDGRRGGGEQVREHGVTGECVWGIGLGG